MPQKFCPLKAGFAADFGKVVPQGRRRPRIRAGIRAGRRPRKWMGGRSPRGGRGRALRLPGTPAGFPGAGPPNRAEPELPRSPYGNGCRRNPARRRSGLLLHFEEVPFREDPAGRHARKRKPGVRAGPAPRGGRGRAGPHRVFGEQSAGARKERALSATGRDRGRFSSKRKTEAVLRPPGGEDRGLLSRAVGVAAATHRGLALGVPGGRSGAAEEPAGRAPGTRRSAP